MKKISLYMLSLIAMGALCLSSCDKGKSKEREEKEEEAGGSSSGFAGLNYLPVQLEEDGPWSLMDKSGKLLFQNEFADRPTAPYNGFFSVSDDNGYTLYKIDGDKYSVVGALSGLYSLGYMSEGLIPASFPNGRIGVYNEKGERKFEIGAIDGDEVQEVDGGYLNGLLPFRTSSDKHGYLDTEGKVAIPAVYDLAYGFSEGLSVVGKKKNSGSWDMIYTVIDTSGKEIFSLQDGDIPSTINNIGQCFSNGYLIADKGNTACVYSSKGEATTFPAEVYHISATDGKYIIYANSDWKYGVMDMSGQVLIRPEYDGVYFANGTWGCEPGTSAGGFLCSSESGSSLINTKGEVKQSAEYSQVISMGKIGLIGVRDGDCFIIDDDWARKGDVTFHDGNTAICYFNEVESNFFDIQGIAKNIAGYVNGYSVGAYTLGTTPSSIFSDEEPKDYAYVSTARLYDLDAYYMDYTITGEGAFTENIATSEWSNYSYRYEYYWNWDSKLGAVGLTINTDKDWGDKGKDALVKAFEEKGYQVVKTGMYNGTQPAVMLRKDNMAVLVATNGMRAASIMVIDTDIKGCEQFYQQHLGYIS